MPDQKPDDRSPVTADPALVMLTVMVESRVVPSLPLILLANGSLVGGALISASEFRVLLMQGYADVAMSEEAQRNIRELIGKALSDARQHERRAEDWLHLRDCSMIQNGQVIQLDGAAALLRVQTAAVSGWALGEMSVLPAIAPR